MEPKQGRVTFLGTGTSQGVPVIACTCSVCRSTDPRDKRLRTSVHVTTERASFNIDIGPDFRQQCLRAHIDRMDAILLTHEHMDHVGGLDDIRPFNYLLDYVMPVYAESRVIGDIKRRFSYIFEPIQYAGLPLINLIEITEESSFSIGDVNVEAIRITHGELPILGFRFGDFVYITDAKLINSQSVEQIKGAHTIVINALHHRPHHSHFNLEEVLAFIQDNNFSNVYLTHISHQMGAYQQVNPELPEGVQLAFDGLSLDFSYQTAEEKQLTQRVI